ncbi:general transcription factor 3C polypeptide 2 [Festucalex cinctus]
MVKETVPEDVDDPEQGREAPPSKPYYNLEPSSRGRQRKKNSRFLDYVTGDTSEDPKEDEAPPEKCPAKAATPRKTPPDKGGRPRAAPRKKTPGKRGRRRTVPPASAPPRVSNGDISAHANVSPSPAVTEDSLENGTPKPKRKFVKKQIVNVEPVAPCEEIQEEAEELPPGGRPRRGAAKTAMKFFHTMVQEEVSHSSEGPRTTGDIVSEPAPKTTQEEICQGEKKACRGQKRKRSNGDATDDDEEFVPDVAEAEEEEGEDEDEDEYEDKDEGTDFYYRDDRFDGHAARVLKTPALLAVAVLETVKTHKKFRDEQLSSWVFPDWLPSTDAWHRVPSSELESYLPRERVSAAFKVSRLGCEEETPPQTLNRFESLPAHAQCWDMHLFAGGPVWALEWCPTPDGAAASQYLAVASHKDMEDEHYFQKTYPGPALVQLWDVGTLDYNTRPNSQPVLAYGLALDQGFIWHLKWCPSGGWELPTSQKEARLLPRLGLLAVVTSMGVVTIYSLPHPDALRDSQKHAEPGDAGQLGCIYKPDPAVTLRLGSLKAPRLQRSGQILAVDWLPVKPHDIIALGFYDGTVGLWDLNTKSALLRVQDSPDSPVLLPYKCFIAHEHAVRVITFCPASRHLVATAGEERLLKTWDLRRLYGPITVQKRSFINEICWPAGAPGLMWAQDGAFSANCTNGVHYTDHQIRSYLAVPRMSAIWSISYSDWLNAMLVSDMVGEVILCMMPLLLPGALHVKRPVERRFPVYLTSLERHDDTGDNKEEEEAAEVQEEDEAEGGRGGDGMADIEGRPYEPYKEAKKKYYLHHTDNNMKHFTKLGKMWKQMRDTELLNMHDMDVMPLASLYKVRLSPNLSSQTWMASGGQAGLVRLNCVAGLNNKPVQTFIRQARGGPQETPPESPQHHPQDATQDVPHGAPL